MSYPILFEQDTTTYTTLGLGTMHDAVSVVITEELNGLYELEMKYPTNGIHYSDLALRRILTSGTGTPQGVQPFRIYQIDKPLNGIITVHAQHISYDLSYYPVEPFTAPNATQAVAGLISHAKYTCPFTITTDKNVESTFKVDVPSSIRSWFGGKEGSLIDVYKGEWLYDGFTCSLLVHRGEDRGVSIRYGKNLITYDREDSDVGQYSHVWGYYEYIDEDGNTQLIQGSLIETDSSITWRKTLCLDLSGSWQEPPTQAQIDTKVRAYIAENKSHKIRQNIALNYLQLADLNEAVYLGDTVTVFYDGEEISAKAQKTVYDALKERFTSVEVGDTRTSLAKTINATTSSANTLSKTISEWVDNLGANYIRTKELEAEYITADEIEAQYVRTSALEAEVASIGFLKVGDADIRYAKIDFANVNNAWIENGVIKNGAIGDAQIIGVSANKLTAGTIDASNITVTNLNASNITTGSITVDGITIDITNNEAEIDGAYIEDGTITLNGLTQDVKNRLVTSIQSYSGNYVPTLANYPASEWQTSAERGENIGNIFWVENAGGLAEGYCYRFDYDNTTGTYGWVLIQDAGTLDILQEFLDRDGDLSGIQTYDVDIALWRIESDGEISSLMTRTTVLEGKVDSIEVGDPNIINLLPTVYYSEHSHKGNAYTSNGITWFVGNDGSITASGTATDDSIFYLTYLSNYDNPSPVLVEHTRQYMFHTTPDTSTTPAIPGIAIPGMSIPGVTTSSRTRINDASNSTYMTYVRCTPLGTTPSETTGTLIPDDGSDNGIAIQAGVARYIAAYIVIYNGYTCPASGITFYPMLEQGDEVHEYVSTHNGTRTLTATYNEIKQSVDENSASITTLTETVDQNNITLTNQVNQVRQTATENTARISNLQSITDSQGTRLTQAESSITQNANAITTKVSQTDYTGNTVVSMINQSATTVSISASKINLNGAVTANNYFKINTDGSMAATAGTIAGWTIDSSTIYKDTTYDGTTYRARMATGIDRPSNSVVFALHSMASGASSFTPEFYVAYNGHLYAKNATIIGSVTATSGKIAGWTISGNKLLSESTGSNRVGLCGLSGEEWAIWAGASAGSSAPFRVGHAGELYASNATISGSVTATSGAIGGWNIGTYTLKGTSVGMCSTENMEWAFWAGASSGNDAPFKVGHGGAVYCSNLTVTGGSISLGGATITSTSFSSNNASINGAFSGSAWISGNNSSFSGSSSGSFSGTGTLGSGSTLTTYSGGTIIYLDYGGYVNYMSPVGMVTRGDGYTTTYYSTGATTSSDKRLKSNITTLDADSTAEFVYSLNPVSFTMKADNAGKHHHGFIAQEVCEVNPDKKWSLVTKMELDDNDMMNDMGYLGINYTELIADLVATVQSLNERIKILEAK